MLALVFPEASWCQEFLLLIGTKVLRMNSQVAPQSMVRLVGQADILLELVLRVSGEIRNKLESGSLMEAEMVSQITLPTGIRVLPNLMGQLPMRVALVLCIQWKRLGTQLWGQTDFQPLGKLM